MTAGAPLEALLFDLGNVVVDVDFERALAAWAKHSSLPIERLRELFSHDDPYCRHETGHLASADYFAHLQQALALRCDLDAVRAGWNAIFPGPIHETLAAVDAVRDRVPCYAFSNTNAVHIAEVERAWPDLLARFRRVFTSHEIGHRKPHAQSFRHVVDAIGVPAARVLFFDDLQPNIDAALACGLQATLVTGPQDVRRELVRRGLLAGPA